MTTPGRPRRRVESPLGRIALYVAIAVAAAIVVAVGYQWLSDDGPSEAAAARRVAPPTALGDLRRVDTAAIRPAEARIRDSFAGQNRDIYSDARFVLYARDPKATTPDLVLVTNDAENSDVEDVLTGTSPAELTRGSLTAAGYPASASFDAGRLGGSLRCATRATKTAAPRFCMWADAATFGLVLSYESGPTATFAALARRLREATER